jgi:hypothetical protein
MRPSRRPVQCHRNTLSPPKLFAEMLTSRLEQAAC